MALKAKESDTVKKRHMEEVGFSGRNTPVLVKGNIERPWGQARGHSCQMRLLSKESCLWERIKAGAVLRLGGRAPSGEKTAGLALGERTRPPERRPCCE